MGKAPAAVGVPKKAAAQVSAIVRNNTQNELRSNLK